MTEQKLMGDSGFDSSDELLELDKDVRVHLETLAKKQNKTIQEMASEIIQLIIVDIEANTVIIDRINDKAQRINEAVKAIDGIDWS